MRRTGKLYLRPATGLAAAYGVAVAGTAAAALLRWALGRVVGPIPAFITFYPVVLASATLGGTKPGLLATLLTALAALFFFIEPWAQPAIPPITDLVALAIFIAINVAISLFGGRFRRARQAMQAASARLETAIANMAEALIACDPQGRILTFNPAALRLYGFSTEAQVPQRLPELQQLFEVSDLSGHPQPTETWPLSRALRGESFTDHEVQVRRRDTGREFVGSFCGALVPGQDPNPTLAIITIRDVTQLRRAEETLRLQAARANAELEQKVRDRTAQLQETVAELEHFSYTITHDMRAPLRAMRGFGGILLEQCGDCLHPERREDLRRIVDSADRMDRLITDALQYSGAVRQRFDLETVDAGALLRGMLESYPQFQPPQAQIRLDAPLPVVLGNKAGLTQCFSNLLGNALKFVRPGQTPEVRVWAEIRTPEPEGDGQGLVRIWFEDQGIGIEKQYQEKIWEMFQQLDKSYEGTGIGLALVRKVVERMGGRVGVESEPGHGSRFWVELKPPHIQSHPKP